jgi:outer membrane murein-binding lipoprotein Lpp
MTVRSNTRASKRAELPAVRRVPLRGADILVGVLALVGIIHIISMLGVESYRSVMSSREIQRLSSDVAQLEAEVAQLQAVVEYGDTPAFREQLAQMRFAISRSSKGSSALYPLLIPVLGR